jgi:hypothetical protein
MTAARGIARTVCFFSECFEDTTARAKNGALAVR